MSYHWNEYKCYVYSYDNLSLIELNLGRQMMNSSFPEQSFQKRRKSLIFQSVSYSFYFSYCSEYKINKLCILIYYIINLIWSFLNSLFFLVSVCVHPIRRLVAYSFLISVYFFNYSPSYARSWFKTKTYSISFQRQNSKTKYKTFVNMYTNS